MVISQSSASHERGANITMAHFEEFPFNLNTTCENEDYNIIESETDLEAVTTTDDEDKLSDMTDLSDISDLSDVSDLSDPCPGESLESLLEAARAILGLSSGRASSNKHQVLEKPGVSADMLETLTTAMLLSPPTLQRLCLLTACLQGLDCDRLATKLQRMVGQVGEELETAFPHTTFHLVEGEVHQTRSLGWRRGQGWSLGGSLQAQGLPCLVLEQGLEEWGLGEVGGLVLGLPWGQWHQAGRPRLFQEDGQNLPSVTIKNIKVNVEDKTVELTGSCNFGDDLYRLRSVLEVSDHLAILTMLYDDEEQRACSFSASAVFQPSLAEAEEWWRLWREEEGARSLSEDEQEVSFEAFDINDLTLENGEEDSDDLEEEFVLSEKDIDELGAW